MSNTHTCSFTLRWKFGPCGKSGVYKATDGQWYCLEHASLMQEGDESTYDYDA